MKKRSIALLMAAMMAMSMAGCGSSASTEAPASDAAESADSADTANAADADGFYAGKTVEDDCAVGSRRWSRYCMSSDLFLY